MIFGRVARVWIGSLLLEDLRVSFRVERTGGREPDRAEVTVSGVDESLLSLVQETSAEVRLEAGYETGIPVLPLFDGNPTRGESRFRSDGVESELRFVLRAAGERFRRETVSLDLRGNTSSADVLSRLASVLGLPLANTTTAVPFPRGYQYRGSLDQLLGRLGGALGGDVRIEDGQLVAVPRGTPIVETALVLSTLLRNTLSVEAADDGVRVTSLLDPRVKPGRTVQVRSRDVDGLFVVRTAQYDGDTHGGEFFVRAWCRPR